MSRVLAEARGWIGTPYVHQASVRGAGCDCLGLVRGVWRAIHGDEPAPVPRYAPDWDEANGEERLRTAADLYLQPAEGLAPGRVILFRMRSDAVAKHLGIVAEVGAAPTFVHAYSRHGVIESPLSAPWRRRIVATYLLEKE